MTIRFSSVFKRDLIDAEERYSEISPKLGDDFRARVKEIVRAVALRGGGDHFGPHGFRCRKCRPFPYLLYYEIEANDLFILGLVQERKHPDNLGDELRKSGEQPDEPK